MWVSSPSARRGLGRRTNALLACTVRSYGQHHRDGHTLVTEVYGQRMTQTTCPFGHGAAGPQGAVRLPRGYDFTDPDVLLEGIPLSSPSCARPRRCGGTSRPIRSSTTAATG